MLRAPRQASCLNLVRLVTRGGTGVPGQCTVQCVLFIESRQIYRCRPGSHHTMFFLQFPRENSVLIYTYIVWHLKIDKFLPFHLPWSMFAQVLAQESHRYLTT